VTPIHPWECGLDTTPPWMQALGRMHEPWWMRAALALHLARVVATTERENVASIGVMRRLGMRVEENLQPEPAWFQVVGVLAAGAGKIPQSNHPREGD